MSIAISRTNGWLGTVSSDLRKRFETRRAASKEARARRAIYRTALAELSVLDDRELMDIGIARSDIPRIAREASEGSRS